MVTILLEKIIALLTGFFGDFIEWANTVGDKIASIKDNTDSLPDIETNTDTIANDTTAINNGVNTLNTRASQIFNRVNSIDQNTAYIKNYSQSIATSSGTTAAFAEDIANNTLDMDSRLVTIGSDTTQIRADSGNLAADVAEIKDTLGLYLYNTIVTEDAEGDIASCDTDLKDYLTEAKVTIPADAGGITGIFVVNENTTEEIAACFKGLLTGTHGFVCLGDYNWTYSTEGSRFATTTAISDISLTTNFVNLVANGYHTISSAIPFSQMQNLDLKRSGSTGNINIRDDSFNGNITNFKSAMQNVYLIYELATPVTPTITQAQFESLNADFSINYTDYQIGFTSITDGAEIDLLSGLIKINTSPVTYDSITPIAIRTYKGVNNIYSDIGTTSVTYRETLKHYLKKQEA